MTDSIKSAPATIAHHMGWDFNQNTSLEALAAWEEYRKLPLNKGTYTDEKDAFTSGFDAGRTSDPHAEAAVENLDTANSLHNQQLRTEHLTKALIHSNLALAAAMNRGIK
jgi:hypothetical protein